MGVFYSRLISLYSKSLNDYCDVLYIDNVIQNYKATRSGNLNESYQNRSIHNTIPKNDCFPYISFDAECGGINFI